MKRDTKFETAYHALRNAVAYAEEPCMICIEITGTQCMDVLDAICPCDVFLQDGEMKHTLLLNDEGIPFADVYACREGESAYLLGYGPRSEIIMDWIIKVVGSETEYKMKDLMTSHQCITLDGPYAWELAAEVFGNDLLGLPYLGMMIIESGLVFRGGLTGEYGYHLIIRNKDYKTLKDKLLETGKSYDLNEADEDVRSQCILENFFFDIHREGRLNLTPPELQLQWRLSQQKTLYPGAKAINRQRELGWNQRLVCFTAEAPVEAYERITCDGVDIGQIAAVGYSPNCNKYVGKALVKKPFWHAGLDAFKVGSIRIKTISAPAVDNLSLKISSYQHSYHAQIDQDETAI